MTDAEELKVEIEKIEEEILILSEKKGVLEAQLKDVVRKRAQESLAKIVGDLKALDLDPAEIARALGVRVAETSEKKARAARGSAVSKIKGIPRYRSPIDPTLTWTGKGRRPAWINTFIENGGDIEEWLIGDGKGN